MSDEPDYMSDEFLQSCIKSADNERPRLIKSRKEQREHDMVKNKGSSNKSRDCKKEDEARELEESLKKPIASDNKGFLMIQKMGFKPGMGLGKNSGGIVVPVTVTLKNDRKGLGTESRRQMIEKKKQIEREKKEKLMNIDNYVSAVSKKHKERQIASDLRKSRRICHQLDIQSNLEEPEEDWFWPEDCLKNEGETNEEKKEIEEKGEEDKVELSEQLERLTAYLRNTYFYCIWCGTQYADEKDLYNCPGAQRELH